MSISTQIGGIKIKNVHHELLKESNSFSTIINEPSAQIIEKGINEYRVNIISYIPNNIKELKHLESSIEITKKLYLKYNGLLRLSTWISSSKNEGFVFCRDFEIVFDSEKETKIFDLYRFSFDYSLKNPGFSVSAEAIYVRDENIDPETSRGTVVTVRSDQK